MEGRVTSPNNYFSDLEVESVESSVTSAKKKNNKKNKNKRKRSSSSSDDINIIKSQQVMIKNLQEEVAKLTQIILQIEDGEEVMEEDEEYPPLPGVDETHRMENNKLSGSGVGTGKGGKEAMKKSHGSISSAATEMSPMVVGKKKPPPVVVYNTDAKDLINKLRSVIGNNNFNVNIVNKNVLKVHTQQLKDYEAVLTEMKSKNIKYFSFTPKEKKPHTYVIKKLPLSYEEEDVKEAIINLKIQIKIIKIIKTKFNWLLQVTNDSNITELKNIKYLLHCKVSVEMLKKSRVVQCKNCQRYNHSALNCNMPYRCVKCCDNHEPGKCLIPPKEKNNEVFVVTNESTGEITNRVGIPVKCVNCGMEGHTANAKVCKIRQNILNKRIRTKNPQQVTGSSYIKRTENMSYASLLKKTNNNKPSAFETINKDCSEIFGKDLLTCFAKVDNFNKQYSLLKTKEEKTQAIFTLLLSLKLDE